MMAPEDFPLWLAIPTAALIVAGAGLAFVGSFGLARLSRFHDRMHAPTLGTSFGTVCIVVASMIYFSVLNQRPVVHEILILVFVTVTTPITLIMLVRATQHRAPPESAPTVPNHTESHAAVGVDKKRTL